MSRIEKPPSSEMTLIQARAPHSRIVDFLRFVKEHWFVLFGGIVLPLVLYAAFNGYPILRTMYLSLFKWNGIAPTMDFVGLNNYSNLLHDVVFRTTLFNNLKWAAFTILFSVGGGLVLAIVLQSGKVYFPNFFRALFFLPSTMSMVTVGIMFKLILNPAFGGMNQLLQSIGLKGLILDWLGDPNVAPYTLIAVFCWYYIGTPMILFFAGIGEIPTELYEAAELEGITAWQRLCYITFPLLKPVTMVVTALAVIQSLKAFDLVLVMTRGGPFNSTSVLGFMMYKQTFLADKYGYGAAISVVILLFSAIFAAFYLRQISGNLDK